jgi:hypothetical protein
MTGAEPLAGIALHASIQALLETLLKPFAETLVGKGMEELPDNPFARVELLLTAYLERTYEHLAYLTPLALPNQRRELLALYLPLTVVDERETSKTKKRIRMDRFHPGFLPKYKRVLLTDSAGMGKSTLLKFLYLSCIHHEVGIPVYVELRKLGAGVSLFDYLASELAPDPTPTDRELLIQILRSNRFVFLLDGYDEIPTPDRDSVATALQQFFIRYPKGFFLVSSRPETPLGLFTGFHHFSIAGLSTEEAFELLRKYDSSRGLAESIITKLKDPSFRDIHEFLSNPLLVSLLYRAYLHKPNIPLRKHIFYRQVYDALFDSHDLSKGSGYARAKLTSLDIEEFHSMLRVLGFITLKAGKVEYDRDELLSYIAQARQRCTGLAFKDAQCLADLVGVVPLFVQDGTSYRWSHKSLQEYFAAQFICRDAKGRESEILEVLYSSPHCRKYLNLMDLCADIDPRTFRQSLARKALRDFATHMATSFCGLSWRPAERDLAYRREISFRRHFVLIAPGALLHNSRDQGPQIEPLLAFMESAHLPKELDSLLLTPLPDGGWLATLDMIQWGILRLLAAKQLLRFSPRRRTPDIRTSNIAESSLGAVEPFQLLDDLPESVWNTPDRFPRAQELLQHPHASRIDAAAALATLEDIEAEIRRDAGELGDLLAL